MAEQTERSELRDDIPISCSTPVARSRWSGPFDSDVKTLGVKACLLLVIAAGCWFALSFSTELKYDRVRSELVSSAYAVVPFDQKAKAFQNDVEATWTRGADEINGPSSDMVRLAGLTPCVSNLIYTFNYQMPEYRWLSPAQNRKAALFGLLKAKFFPVSVDKVWHVSDDRRLAVLWCRTNMVYVYRDEATGMHETLFYKKKQIIEPNGAANLSQPIRSETNRASATAGSGR